MIGVWITFADVEKSNSIILSNLIQKCIGQKGPLKWWQKSCKEGALMQMGLGQ